MVVLPSLSYNVESLGDCSSFTFVVSLMAVPVNSPLFFSIYHITKILRVDQHCITMLSAGKSSFF